MAEDEGVQRSVALMDYHRRNGNRDLDPKTYVHNVKIRKLFERVKKRAWAQVKQDQRAQKLIQEARDYKVRTVEARRESINQLINIPK